MNGLLLAGGRSARMGSDKAALSFHDGQTQLERGLELLNSVCEQSFVSLREDQKEPNKINQNSIVDAFGEIGPLGAIASAQQQHPDATWLVLACDLPLLEKTHIQTLVNGRDNTKDATYFTSATDGFPEPLCAIWEPSSRNTIRDAVDAGKRCPRSVLKHLNGKALPSPGLWPLANINTEADALEIRTRLNHSTTMKTITVSYYAQLRELTGTTSEPITTDAETPAGLFEEIRAKHAIPLKRKGMMVAINGDFTDWTHQLNEGEEVVFIPPVAGG